MVALELVDILPELNGALPHRDEGRRWIAREGRFVEVDASLGVIEPVNERALDDPRTPVVRLHDGGTLTVEETDAGLAIVRARTVSGSPSTTPNPTPWRTRAAPVRCSSSR